MLQDNINKAMHQDNASDTLKKLQKLDSNGSTKIGKIIDDFHENGLLFALIFFALPVAIPLPYPPGFTTLLGTPLLILSFQMLKGSNKVYLPSKITEYSLKNSTLIKVSKKAVPLLQYIEKYSKPRTALAKSVYAEQVIGLFCIIASLAIAVPLPFTNAIPAQGICVMALGLMNRDGIVIAIGFIINVVGCIIAALAMIGSWLAVKFTIIKSLEYLNDLLF